MLNVQGTLQRGAWCQSTSYNDVIGYLDNKKILQDFHYYMKLRQTAHAWDTELKFKNISKKKKKRKSKATWRKDNGVLQACATGVTVWHFPEKDSGVTCWIWMNAKFEKIRNNGRKTDTALKTISWHLMPSLKESLKK